MRLIPLFVLCLQLLACAPVDDDEGDFIPDDGKGDGGGQRLAPAPYLPASQQAGYRGGLVSLTIGQPVDRDYYECSYTPSDWPSEPCLLAFRMIAGEAVISIYARESSTEIGRYAYTRTSDGAWLEARDGTRGEGRFRIVAPGQRSLLVLPSVEQFMFRWSLTPGGDGELDKLATGFDEMTSIDTGSYRDGLLVAHWTAPCEARIAGSPRVYPTCTVEQTSDERSTSARLIVLDEAGQVGGSWELAAPSVAVKEDRYYDSSQGENRVRRTTTVTARIGRVTAARTVHEDWCEAGCSNNPGGGE